MGSPSGKNKTRIDSVAQLQSLTVTLLERLNADQSLARAAAVNPLLALEELGYELSPDVRQDLEERSRFTQKQIVQRRKLKEDLARAVGRDVDVTSPTDVRRLLVEDLKLAHAVPHDLSLPRAPPRVGARAQRAYSKDSLEDLGNAHPVMKHLLAVRALEAAVPGFAAVDLYRAVRSGERKLPVVKLTGRIAPERPPGSARSRRPPPAARGPGGGRRA